MQIKTLSTGPYEEICSILWNENNQSAIVFDPGFDAQKIIQTLEKNNLTVAAYICTHGHADHINALFDLHQHQSAPILMHSADWNWAFSAINQIPPHYPVPQCPEPKTYFPLESSNHWNFADLNFQTLETPGHTPGSCCLYFPDAKTLISGDTLFKGSCGRTDLPNGDARLMKQSLEQLKQLPPETLVYPGHGPETTIGLEIQTNFFMQ